MSMRNPFTPTFGMVPPHLAGRGSILRTMGAAFDNGPGDPNLSSMLIGARGTGKTALLACIADEARQRGWVAARVTAAPGMLEDIIERSAEEAAHLVEPDPSMRVSGIGIAQVLNIEFERPSAARGNWRTRMNALLNALNGQGAGLLITVDEVKADLDEMVQLASTYQHFVQEGRKVALVMAGLPYETSSLADDRTVSFLRRARQHQLGRIPDPDVESALRKTVSEAGGSIEPDALSRAVEETGGFAFMMQLVGYWSWNEARGAVIDDSAVRRGVALAHDDMREGVYAATFRSLSEGDVRFLEAMLAEGGKCTLADVAKRLGKPSNYASKYKVRLMKQGIVGDTGRNNLRIDMPGFLQYLQEQAS